MCPVAVDVAVCGAKVLNQMHDIRPGTLLAIALWCERIPELLSRAQSKDGSPHSGVEVWSSRRRAHDSSYRVNTGTQCSELLAIPPPIPMSNFVGHTTP